MFPKIKTNVKTDSVKATVKTLAISGTIADN